MTSSSGKVKWVPMTLSPNIVLTLLSKFVLRHRCLGSSYASVIREEGHEGKCAYVTIALHSRWIGRPGRFVALKRMIEHFTSYDDVWFATREQIARHWVEKFPYVPKK